MKANVDKNIEQLTDKLLMDTALESPSLNFTAHVMSRVEAIAQSSVTAYKPLISKKVWIGLFTIIAAIFAYSIFGTTTESTVIPSIDFSILTNNKISHALSSLNASKTIIYAVVMFTLMFGIQIPLLKGYFDRRLSI